MLLLALTYWADGRGLCEASYSQLAQFIGGSVETARSGIKKLIDAGCVQIEKAGRDGDGMFGSNRYLLVTSQDGVAEIFGRLRTTTDTSSPHPDFRSSQSSWYGEKQNRDPKTGIGPYIDSRARARASSIIFIHTLPDDYAIEDEDLKRMVEQVLGVCGVGLADVSTPGLLDSLVECLPEAIEAGFDFEDDILPCVKRKTAARRHEPLWSFRVIFHNDLPVWKQARLKKGVERAQPPSRPERDEDGSRRRTSTDQLDALLERGRGRQDASARLVTLENIARQLADPYPPDWLLPKAQRNLVGEEREVAIEQARERTAAELKAVRAQLGAL